MTMVVLGIAEDRALGGSMRVIVTRPQSLVAAKAAVDQVLREIDLAASRFREDSELSRLNTMPDKVLKVSALLAQAIETAIRGAELTDGAVDPTIGHALEVTGYDTDFSSVAPQGAALRLVAKRVPGWQAIRFNPTARTVLIPRGVVIDLGATGKALAADLAANAAAKATGSGVLVGLGGDVSVAGEPPAGGWLVQVSEDSAAPIEEGEETVSITAGGIATSGTTVRRWTRGGVVLHHIIDPVTGLPVEGPWRTATVAAASCVDANIASTAAIVLGDDAVAWLKIQGLAARLVDREGQVRRVGSWPKPGDSKLAHNLF